MRSEGEGFSGRNLCGVDVEQRGEAGIYVGNDAQSRAGVIGEDHAHPGCRVI